MILRMFFLLLFFEEGWVEREVGGQGLPILDLAGVLNVCTFAFQNVFLMVPNDVLVMRFPTCVQIVDVTLYFLSFAQCANSSKVYIGWIK
jgi:hypothetical protein